jgi:hypothetical protein
MRPKAKCLTCNHGHGSHVQKIYWDVKKHGICTACKKGLWRNKKCFKFEYDEFLGLIQAMRGKENVE